MIKANYHTHTFYCRHADGTAADYAAAAAAAGLVELGFSEHGPFPGHDFGLRMNIAELPRYLSELDTLKYLYQRSMKIRSGLEMEYLPSKKDWYQQLFKEYHVEYLALGEHIFQMPDGSLKNIYQSDSTRDYLSYAASLMEGMRSGFFAFVAHPDLMLLHDLPWDDNCEQACDLIISTARELDFILEYNANGYRRGLQEFCDGTRYPYPDMRFWKKVAAAGIRTIVGSDCHQPSHVWDSNMQKAQEDAISLGLNVLPQLP